MTEQHPIKPPSLAIIKKWIIANGLTVSIVEASAIASLASRLGADQELEACCEWVVHTRAYGMNPGALRTARRPKPPSLKEQALMALEDGDLGPGASLTPVEVCTIRRALEQLDD